MSRPPWEEPTPALSPLPCDPTWAAVDAAVDQIRPAWAPSWEPQPVAGPAVEPEPWAAFSSASLRSVRAVDREESEPSDERPQFLPGELAVMVERARERERRTIRRGVLLTTTVAILVAVAATYGVI